MSEGRTAAGAAHRLGTGTTRLVRAWRVLPHESRLAAFASAALFITLFLPWYQVTLIATAKSARLQSASAAITGWGAFSFVEAAVLLVAAAVLMLLFQRAEGRAFHLPGGDGAVITAAGVWTSILIVWRIFDKQGATTNGPSATTSGVEWGIFIALAAAAFLGYSGSRIRAAHRPEPPLPGEDNAPAGSSAAAVARPPRRTSAAAASASASAASTERPRRRARPPMPVPADPRPPGRPADVRSDRPRRRLSAGELFERVTPDDPPTMPFGRASRSPEPSPPPATAPSPDEQLTIPFAGREDDTQPLTANRRAQHPQSDDATLPLHDDATRPLHDDATLPLRDDPTLPLRDDATLPLRDDATVPLRDDATVPLGEDDTLPVDR
jgi:hypothetical protein